MIYIDNKPLDDVDHNSLIYKHINKALTQIKKKDGWKIVFTDQFTFAKHDEENGSFVEYSSGRSLIARVPYDLKGTKHYISVGNLVQTKQDRFVLSNPRIDYSGNKTYSSKSEAEKIFFLTCLSGYCEENEDLKPYQVLNNNKAKMWRVEDVEKEALVRSNTERDKLKILTSLYDDESGFSDDKIRYLGKQFNISGADKDLNIDVVRQNLQSTILTGKAVAQNIKKFFEDALEHDAIMLKSSISSLVEKDLITTDEVKGVSSYCIKDKEKLVFSTPTVEKEPMEKTLFKALSEVNERVKNNVFRLLNNA